MGREKRETKEQQSDSAENYHQSKVYLGRFDVETMIRFGRAQIYSPMEAKSRFRSQNEDNNYYDDDRKVFL